MAPSMEKFSHSHSSGIRSYIALLPHQGELGSPFKRVNRKGVVKKCPQVNLISSIFSSALPRMNQPTPHKGATKMPHQPVITLRPMYVCLYRQGSDNPTLRTKVPFQLGANLSVNEG